LTVRAIAEDPGVLIVEQSHSTFDNALDLYDRRPDKRYSMTDCSSMCHMMSTGITDVLTNDRHFVQEGFTALLAD
jgi:predicted nucleic acid-binding protein